MMEGRRTQWGRELATCGVNFGGGMDHGTERGDGSGGQRDPYFCRIKGLTSVIETSGGDAGAAGATDKEAAWAGTGRDSGVGAGEWVAVVAVSVAAAGAEGPTVVASCSA